MVTGGHNPAVIQHQNDVRLLHRGDPLGDNQLGGAGNLLPEGLADHGVGLGIHGGGGVVQNQDFGLFQQRAGDAQPLLLSAGNIGAALLDVGIIAVGEAADKLVRAG